LRSALSILGIVIGIFAVSLTVSLGGGVQEFVISSLSSYGTGIVSVQTRVPGLSSFGTSSARVQGIEVTTLKPSDFKALEALPFVESTSSYNMAQGIAVVGNKEKQLLMIAATENYQAVDPQVVIDKGRFFNANENNGAENVIVLGSEAKQTFFGDSDPLGQMIRIRSASFRVIGTVVPRGQSFGFNLDTVGYIPLKTAQHEILGIDYVQEGVVKLAPGYSEAEAAAAIADFMRRRHHIIDPAKDDFSVTTMDQVIGIATTVTDVMRFLLVTLAAISLLVGGIGIMNIMLVSVTERLHEIGIRKSYGATLDDVFNQFVVESITLTSLGGIIGTILAVLSILLVGVVLRANGYAWKLGVPIESIVIAITVAAVIGYVFGLYPARKAGRMSTIEALKID